MLFSYPLVGVVIAEVASFSTSKMRWTCEFASTHLDVDRRTIRTLQISLRLSISIQKVVS
jgi:hypothetical protein